MRKAEDADGMRTVNGAGDARADGCCPSEGGQPVTDDRMAKEMDALEREITVFHRRSRASAGEMARQVHPDLEWAAYGLLVRLAEVGAERATDLATYFGVGKATMSRQLRALEQLGLVSREPDPADGRAFLIRLTEEGRTRFARVRNARRARYLRQLAAWDRSDITELARLLHQLNDLNPDT